MSHTGGKRTFSHGSEMITSRVAYRKRLAGVVLFGAVFAVKSLVDVPLIFGLLF